MSNSCHGDGVSFLGPKTSRKVLAIGDWASKLFRSISPTSARHLIAFCWDRGIDQAESRAVAADEQSACYNRGERRTVFVAIRE